MANAERMFVVLNDMFTPPKEFTEKRLSFSVPQPTTEHDRNTLVTISGIPGRGYYGEVDVYYDRMDLADYVTSFDFRSLETMTREMIVLGLSNKFGLDINPEDFEEYTPPVLGDGEAISSRIEIAETSLQWFGGLDLNLSFGPSWLDSMIGTTDLDIFKHPNATNRQSSRMWTWGADFSGIQDALKPTAKGEYSDWALVQTVARAMGIPDWVKGKVVDKATAEVPDANPAFQRVVIQSTVQSGLLQGAMYFHYNPA